MITFYLRPNVLWRESRWHCEYAYRSSHWAAKLYIDDITVAHCARHSLTAMLLLAAFGGSQRLACVSTAVSGVPELIEHGRNGVVVPPEDPGALAKALAQLIRDPDLRQRLGSAAEERVRSDFDHHSSVRQLSELFRDEWSKAS